MQFPFFQPFRNPLFEPIRVRTQEGEFFGLLGTVKRLSVMGTGIVRFDSSGKAVEHWSEDDARFR